MRLLLALLVLTSSISHANTGGLVGDPGPQPVRSVKKISISHSEDVPLNGFFTKFEEFHLTQIMERDLREKLASQPGTKFEQYTSASASSYGPHPKTTAFVRGELQAFAVSATILEGFEEVEGWHVSITYPGWFNPVFTSREPIDPDSVILTPNGLLLAADEMEAIEKELRWREDFWKAKINRNKLIVHLKPMKKERYWVMDIQTSGMFNWKDLTSWQRLELAQSREFLTYLNSCQLALATKTGS